MKKQLFVLLGAIIFLFSSSMIAPAQDEHYSQDIQVVRDTQDSREKTIQDFLLAILSPYIDQAIEQYYGERKQYALYIAKIVDIRRFSEKGQFNFEIKVKVMTFEGPHNPPYGFETITIVNDSSKITVTKFEHSVGEID